MSETSLQEVLQREALPPKPARLSILQQVAEELDTAHRRNKLHGHLTPKSIVIAEGTARGALIAEVTDFGAKFVLDNEILGDRLPDDVHYISPEQLLGIDLGEQSDLFSFAVIAYEMVCGRKPFEAENISPLFYKICTEPAESVEKVDPTLSAEVNEVFNRALAKKPEWRYANGKEFIQALTTALSRCEGWQESVRAPEPPPAVAAAAPSNPISKPPTPEFQQRFPAKRPYELPTLQRRRRYRDEDDDEEDPRLRPQGSRAKKLMVAAAIGVFLLGAGVFFTGGLRTPNLPVQVLDTKSGQSTPPPSSSAAAQTPSTSAAAAGPTQEAAAKPAGASPETQPSESAADPNAPPATPSASQPATPSAQPGAPAAESTTSPQSATAAQPTGSPQGATASKDATPEASPSRLPNRPANRVGPSRSADAGGTANVEFLTIPPGGRMVIDNNPLMTCTAPCTMPLGNGRHTLRAQMQGYAVAQRVFTVPDESTQTMALSRQTGALVVTSVPAAATILVDGTDFGLTPATLHLTPGQHRLTLLNGSQRHEEVVTVVGDGIQAANITFPQ